MKQALLLPGIIFLLVNLTASYMFYQVNTYKMVLVLMGVTLLTLLPQDNTIKVSWKTWGVIFTPLLATFPGLIYHQLGYNYNFRYELATNLMLILWIIYLYRNTKQLEDINILLVFIAVTVIYVNFYTALIDMDSVHFARQGRVRSTFGNFNYFAGFLVIVLPILLVSMFDADNEALRILYLFASLTGTLVLYGTKTRAAIAAFIVSIIITGLIYIYRVGPEEWRKKIPIAFYILTAFIAYFAVTQYLFGGFEDTRFGHLFTLRTWIARIKSWEAAIASIQASPIIGFGLGSSYNLYFMFFDPSTRLFHWDIETSYNHVHSEPLEYLQEGGAVGMIVLILFWIYILRQLIKLIRAPNASMLQLKLSIGITGGLIAYHLHSVFSVAPRMIVVKLPLYTLIGLVFVLRRIQNEN